MTGLQGPVGQVTVVYPPKQVVYPRTMVYTRPVFYTRPVVGVVRAYPVGSVCTTAIVPLC
ncbi:hypothetical protein [Streptosporangium sandarakinum]|uniref:hypothetical protein n=1 Tax=Streptosporangium sandarakinum TaxID=1260955 RepID=UPI0033A32665